MDGFVAALSTGELAVFLPAALLLGALHALEPGHAKTMIASFIIATHGTPARALVLGLSAAVSHSLVVWALVLTTMWLGLTAVPEAWQPMLGAAAGVFALLIAAWMGWRQWRGGHHHHHHHHHGHARHDPGRHPVGLLQGGGGHGGVRGPVHHDPGHHRDGLHQGGHHQGGHHHDGHRHGDHGHVHPGHGHDHHPHPHPHPHPPLAAADPGWLGTIGFGITGGLMPCPAALAVLLLCLQAGAAATGALMVGAFSVGLAVVLVGVGVAASVASGIAMRHSGFLAGLGARAPWLSVAIIAASGLYTLVHALRRVT